MITRGTILIEKDTLCPKCFGVEDGSYPSAWMSVRHNLTFFELEKELAATGWTHFCLDQRDQGNRLRFGEADKTEPPAEMPKRSATAAKAAKKRWSK